MHQTVSCSTTGSVQLDQIRSLAWLLSLAALAPTPLVVSLVASVVTLAFAPPVTNLAASAVALAGAFLMRLF